MGGRFSQPSRQQRHEPRHNTRGGRRRRGGVPPLAALCLASVTAGGDGAASATSSSQQPPGVGPFHILRHAPPLHFMSETVQNVNAKLDEIRKNTQPDFRQLNKVVVSQFKEFLDSERGHAISSQLDQEMSGGTLAVPVIIIERLVKQRINAMMEENSQRLFAFFMWRTMFASLAVHSLKVFVRYLARRHKSKRFGDWVHFLSEVLMPAPFWGPVIGIGIGMQELSGELRLPFVRYNEEDRTAMAETTKQAQEAGKAAGSAVAQAVAAVAGPSIGAFAGGIAGAAAATMGSAVGQAAGAVMHGEE